LLSAGYPDDANYELLTQFHHGGYAKSNPALLNFCASLHQESGLLVEPVYNRKMFYALHQLVLAGKFKHNETVVAVHTGGLQGLRGFSSN